MVCALVVEPRGRTLVIRAKRLRIQGKLLSIQTSLEWPKSGHTLPNAALGVRPTSQVLLEFHWIGCYSNLELHPKSELELTEGRSSALKYKSFLWKNGSLEIPATLGIWARDSALYALGSIWMDLSVLVNSVRFCSKYNKQQRSTAFLLCARRVSATTHQ